MTDQEFRAVRAMLSSIARTAQLIPIEDVQHLIETADRADSIMPILDPTAWRNGADNLVEQREIAEGFLAFRRAIESVKARKLAQRR